MTCPIAYMLVMVDLFWDIECEGLVLQAVSDVPVLP